MIAPELSRGRPIDPARVRAPAAHVAADELELVENQQHLDLRELTQSLHSISPR